MRNTKLVSFSSMSEKWAVILKNCTLDHKGAIFENRSESSHISLSGFCNRKLTRVLLNRSHKALSEVSAPKYFGIFLEFQWSYKHALKPGFHDFSNSSGQFSSVAQSCLTLCDPMDCSMPGLPVHHHHSWSLLKLMSIKSVMPSNHLILCGPLLLLPSFFPSIRVFSNESVLRIRCPKYWSFSFSISPSNEYSGLISFRIDWFEAIAVC